MGQKQCEFLYGRELSNRIREVCDAPNVDCAVAFWGVGMKSELFPHAGDGKIRIVCDISMGGTCRKALGEWGAPQNVNLKVHEKFHGKVYISSRGAVIGSPNASDNGVGREADAGGKLIEAGVFCPTGSEAYSGAANWFEGLFVQASVIGIEELLSAPERSRELRPRGSRKELAGFSLLRRLQDFPINFPEVHIAIAIGDLNEKMAEASKMNRVATRGTAEIQLEDDVILQNDEGGKLPSFTGPLLLLWHRGLRTQVHAYIDCSTWPPSTPDTVFGVDNSEAFWKAIDQHPPASMLTGKDSARIGRMVAAKDGQWLFTVSEFAARLATFPV